MVSVEEQRWSGSFWLEMQTMFGQSAEPGAIGGLSLAEGWDEWVGSWQFVLLAGGQLREWVT